MNARAWEPIDTAAASQIAAFLTVIETPAAAGCVRLVTAAAVELQTRPPTVRDAFAFCEAARVLRLTFASRSGAGVTIATARALGQRLATAAVRFHAVDVRQVNGVFVVELKALRLGRQHLRLVKSA